MAQWLRLCSLNAEGPGLVPGQGARLHMPESEEPVWHNEDQRSHVMQLRPGAIK